MPLTTSIYGLASRSLQSRDRCSNTKLDHSSSLCIFPFHYDFKSAPKNKTGMCSSSDSNCTSLEYLTTVPRILKPLCQGTSAAAPGTSNPDKPKKYCPPIDGGEAIDTTGLVGFRKPFYVKEFQKTLPTLSQILDEKAHSLIMSQPGENGLAGVLNEKLILFRHLQRIL